MLQQIRATISQMVAIVQKMDPTTSRNIVVSWMDLIDTGEAIIKAGLLADHGQAGFESAYDAVRPRERGERDRRLDQLLGTLSRREWRP